MAPAFDAFPDDVAALKAVLVAARERGLITAAELAVARAKAAEDQALIASQKLRIAKLERQVYGQRSERSARLIEQLSLEFEELAASATEDELAAEMAVAKTTNVRAFTRRPAERNTFPDHLPRERVVIDPPTVCECCGGSRLRKLGEGRVGVWRDGVRLSMSVAAPFVWRCLSGSAVAPFPHPPHRTGRADFPHPALGQDLTPSSTARRAQGGSGVRARSARRGARVDSSRPLVA